MKILIATDVRAVLCNGTILTTSPFFTILRRYYEAFGPVILCARCGTVETVESGFEDISDMVERVVGAPDLQQFLLNQCNKAIEEAMMGCQLVIGRCPSISAYKAFDVAKKLNKPFFVESMGCAWDAYWNHGVVGKLIAPYMYFKMKSVVRNADYALYVTNEFLQKRYPCKNESIAASNVMLPELDASVLEKRLQKLEDSRLDKEIVLMTTAAVNVRYKGQQYVIEALKELNKQGIRCRYILIGDGDRTFLQSEAARHGVQQQVEFKGRLSLAEVFGQLDDADIYIQPSLQEGLPRAMIEAMSRGCPCIGAKTAGIPELISPEFVVKRKSVADIVEAVKKICEQQTMIEQARKNFETAKDYQNHILSERRTAYYRRIKGGISGDENL